jgi:putative hydrolase of the HAD superfamily
VQPDASVKNLIFDLGGVILDLSVDHTLQAFADAARMDKHEVIEIFRSEPGFELYEKGAIDDAGFRDMVRRVYGSTLTDPVIDHCWNAMLRGLPLNKLELLLSLKQRYNVFLLSNTNGIHLQYIHDEMLSNIPLYQNLDAYFHKAYYSHRLRMRKPDAEIFEHVLKDNGLRAEQTLFLDDNLQNIQGANAVGIKTLHVVTPDQILAYFS